MNEQEMRDKVIQGLEICSAGRWNAPNERDCTSCPYYPAGYTGCTCKLLMRDALALLKAQEPRVMTLEEYEAWIDTPFTERNPVFHEERTKRGTVTSWVNTVVCSLSEYGKNDRCWTSRPDEKRRVETPWN